MQDELLGRAASYVVPAAVKTFAASGITPEFPRERAAVVTLQLVARGFTTSRTVRNVTGLGKSGANCLLHRLSTVLPLKYNSRAKAWLLIGDKLRKYDPGRLTSLSRAAVITWHVAFNGEITIEEAAQLTGLSLRGARKAVSGLAVVLPIYYDGRHSQRRWVLIEMD